MVTETEAGCKKKKKQGANWKRRGRKRARHKLKILNAGAAQSFSLHQVLLGAETPLRRNPQKNEFYHAEPCNVPTALRRVPLFVCFSSGTFHRRNQRSQKKMHRVQTRQRPQKERKVARAAARGILCLYLLLAFHYVRSSRCHEHAILGEPQEPQNLTQE